MDTKINIIGNGRGRTLGFKADGLKWTVNICSPRCDAMFDVHPVGMYPKHAAQREKAIQAGQELITLDNYPIKEITEYFNTEYFTNSIPYMVALAIYRDAEIIDFYGCHIKPDDDAPLFKGHWGVEYWLGVATGHRIDVRIHGESALLSLPDGMYGYRWVDKFKGVEN